VKRVTGIGGIFFKSDDNKKLNEWYEKHLGIEMDSYGGHTFKWREMDNDDDVGATVFSVFKGDTDYFDPGKAPFMINFRVDDLHGLLAKLREEGANVIDKVEEFEYGKFGWVLDPDGNKIELWEAPKGKDSFPDEG